MSNELATSSTLLALPSGGADVRGLGETFQTDLYTGTGAYSIPIELPSAQNGFKPELSLQYSTGAGNGIFGQGWYVPVMTLQRSHRKGFPQYDDLSDVFVFGDDLVPLEAGRFRPRTDTKGWRILRERDHWTVTTKDGVVHVLGSSANARIEHPQGLGAFQWLLDEMRTPTGNRAEFRYIEDGGGRLIQSVSYGPFRIVFEYEGRRDPVVSRRAGFSVVQNLRCREIRVDSERSMRGWLRRYRLEYRDDAGVSLLTRVILEAGDLTERLAMPDVNFQYGAWTASRISVGQVSGDASPLPALGDPSVDLVDLEGTGRPGIIQGTLAGWAYWPNRGNAKFGGPRILANVPNTMTAADDRVRFLDLEGNGTVDLLWAPAGGAGFFPNAAGGTWEDFVPYGSDLPFDLTDPELRLYDADGDGRIDVVITGPDAFLAFRNLGRDGWSDTPLRIPRIRDASVFPDVSFSDPQIFTGDMTGDGLTDIVLVRSGEISYWPYEAVGRWAARVEMAGAPVLPHDFDPSHVRLIDVDGDGRSDLVYLGTDVVTVWFNDGGNRWSAPTAIPAPGLARDEAVVVDLLGMGRPGVFWNLPDITGQESHHFLSFGSAPEHRMLVEVRGGLGHVTRISYGTSVGHRLHDEERARQWRTFLPFSITVVDQIDIFDAPASIQAATRYSYHDGHFDGLERTFNGFGEVDQGIAGDDTSPEGLVKTRFHPGTDPAIDEAARRQLDLDDRESLRALRGTPLQIDRYEQQSGGAKLHLMERTAHVLSARIERHGTYHRVVVPFPVTATTEEGGGGADLRRTVIRHGEPDSAVNPTWTEFEAGVVRSDGNYERTGLRREIFDYVETIEESAPYWLPGLIRQRATLNADGHVLACVRVYYDGPEFEGLPFGRAERGLVTRVEELVSLEGESLVDDGEMAQLGHHRLRDPGVLAPGWYRNRSRTRTAPTGQVLVARDALGNDATITYDTWGIDPVHCVDAAGMVTSASYDHAVELMASVTNPSGVTEQRIYDPLGRTRHVLRTGASGALNLVAVVRHDHGDFGPGGDSTRPPSITTLMPWNSGRTSDQLEDESAPLATLADVTIMRRFYGASGTELETVSSGPLREDGRRTPVHSGERMFNVQAKIAGEGRPRFVNHFGPLPRLGMEAPYSHVYDGSGREVRLTFPGGRREQRFEPFRTVIADANAVAAGLDANIERRFDGFGRLVRVRERIDGTLDAQHWFEYSSGNQVDAVRAADGGVLIQYRYDCLGRRIYARHRDLGVTRYIHDALGNLVRTDHATGNNTQFAYDPTMRLVAVQHRRADGTIEATHRFFYDRSPDGSSACAGRLCAIEDNAGLTILDYGADARLIAKRRTTPEGKHFVFRFEYDFRGLLSVIEYPNGRRVAYEYGAEGEIARVDGFIERIGYDQRGRPTVVVYPNGMESRFTYDDTDRLAAIETRRGGTVVSRFRQDYDGVGNPVRLGAFIDTLLDEERRLEYDMLHRLVGASGRRNGVPFAHVYSYDPDGNLLRNTEHSVAQYLYEDSVRTGLLTGIVTEQGEIARARRYDMAGRLIESERLAELAYDTSGHLVRVATYAGRVEEMRYDAHGHRARITASTGTAGASDVRDIFDDLYEESDDGNVIYIRAIGGIVAAVHTRASHESHQETWHHDPHGSLRFVADPRGSILEHFSYTSFGDNVEAPGAYLGKIPDPALGLVQMGARFYEPYTGRFTTPDLLLLERPDLGLSDPSLFNLYAYSLNNPYRYRDPRGRFVWLVVIAGVLIGGALGYQAAKENGQNPWTGALIGGLIGGLAGAGGVLGSALLGGAVGAAVPLLTGGSSREIWTGAALGFAFGALGGAVNGWLPVVGGDTFGAHVANALIEIGSDALIGGLAGGSYSALQGRNFEDGFRAGLVMGAAASAARIAVFGVRYDPSSIKQDFHGEAAKEFSRQNVHDHSYLAPEVKVAGMPNPSTVQFRTGGLVHYLNGDRAFALGNTVHTDSNTMQDLRNGSVTTLTHELRHIAQQRAATFGAVEFLAIWLYQQITSDQQYQPGPANTTLEPAY
ncbi:MAG: SpvB/TcaC N-terminal domain-containing protein [Acidobacteriota bacterium]